MGELDIDTLNEMSNQSPGTQSTVHPVSDYKDPETENELVETKIVLKIYGCKYQRFKLNKRETKCPCNIETVDTSQ